MFPQRSATSAQRPPHASPSQPETTSQRHRRHHPIRSHYLATEPIHANDDVIDVKTPAQIRQELTAPSDYTSIEMDARVFAPASLRAAIDDAHAADARRSKHGRSSDDLDLREERERVSFAPRSRDADFSTASLRGATSPSPKSAALSAWQTDDVTTSPGKQRYRDMRGSGSRPDELDVVDTVTRPEVTSAPLVASIREELQRLSSAVSPRKDSIKTFK